MICQSLFTDPDSKLAPKMYARAQFESKNRAKADFPDNSCLVFAVNLLSDYIKKFRQSVNIIEIKKLCTKCITFPLTKVCKYLIKFVETDLVN